MTAKTSRSAGQAGGKRGGLSEVLTLARVVVLVLVALALVFIFQNTRETEIRLLVPEVTMPLWLALLGVGVIGALCGAYLMRRRG